MRVTSGRELENFKSSDSDVNENFYHKKVTIQRVLVRSRIVTNAMKLCLFIRKIAEKYEYLNIQQQKVIQKNLNKQY